MADNRDVMPYIPDSPYVTDNVGSYKDELEALLAISRVRRYEMARSSICRVREAGIFTLWGGAG